MINTPVIILHGWNLSKKTFLPLENELRRKKINTYSLDLPPFGKNEELKKPLFLSDYVALVLNYLEKQRLKKIILIGHSFGGRIAIKLACQNPKIIKALILTGVPGINQTSRVKILVFYFVAKFGNVLFSIWPFVSFKTYAKKLLYKFAQEKDYQKTSGFLRDTFKNIISEDLRPYMQKILCPVLLLWGRNDGTVPLRVAYKMKEIILNSQIKIIDDANHKVPYEKPAQFCRITEEFIYSI